MCKYSNLMKSADLLQMQSVGLLQKHMSILQADQF